ncbi:MAG: ABC transporter substrate-binding protein [Synechococcales bacterium]|nr:ABC transporter substrate-binding protein [Synechococcales bacterium]
MVRRGMRSRLISVLFLISLVFTMLVMAVGCQPGSGGRSPGAESGRITIGTTASLNTIDPADATSSFAGLLQYNLCDRLYTYQLGSRDLVPQLATAMPQVSADGLTYRIPLRQGVVYHDGTAFDAAAMAFSLQRFTQAGGNAASILGAIDQVTATAPYELTIRLKEPFAAFPSLLAYAGACAVSPKAYQIPAASEGEAKKFKPKELIGTGAYQLTDFGTDRLRLEIFDRYWGDKPQNQGIDIQVFSSPANLFNAFRTGAVDLAIQGMATEQVQTLQQQASGRGWKVLEQSGGSIDFLVMNVKSAPLDQLPVRQAIAALINRSILQSRVFLGQVEPLYSLIPNSFDVQKPTFKERFGDRNLETAKTLLKQVGYSVQEPLVVDLWYRSNLVNDQLAATTLKADANRELQGLVKFQLNSVETTTAYARLEQGLYPIFLLDWTGDYFDPDTYIYPFLECTEGSVQTACKTGQSAAWGSFYYSDRANQLLAQSRAALDPAKRKQIFEQLQQLVAEEVPFIPLWQSKDYLFVQAAIEGASLEVTQKVPFRQLRRS